MRSLILLALLGYASAACPNSCSGHGECDNNDQCICYLEAKVLNEDGNNDEGLQEQWTGADCSLMTCPRGTSWNRLPWDDTDKLAHQLSKECSDAGVCDRSTGQCECYEGYEGSACQRTTCPNDCSGHGVCQSNLDFAEDYARAIATSINLKAFTPRCDGSGVYDDSTCPRNIEHVDDYYQTYMVSYDNAWDSGLQFGCNCDAGYSGADCSLRDCPSSDDPLDDSCQVMGVDDSWLSIAVDSSYLLNDDADGYISDTDNSAADYVNLYGRELVFQHVNEFFTARNHFSDLARHCTAFYRASMDDSTLCASEAGCTVLPFNIDHWLCDYMWDSTLTKVPYCGGQWSGGQCSGRGLCDTSQGICSCFSGYTGNDCSDVEELA